MVICASCLCATNTTYCSNTVLPRTESIVQTSNWYKLTQQNTVKLLWQLCRLFTLFSKVKY